MRLNRTFLYAGVFLVALGGMLVAANLGAFDSIALTDALRLWPLALIAIGLGIALRRTEFSVPTGMLAAAMPGLVLGGAIAVAPRYVPVCDAWDRFATYASEHASHRADLDAYVDFANVDPIGGCK